MLLCVCVTIALFGCSAKKEYLSIEDYRDTSHINELDTSIDVSDYSQMKASMISMVSQHAFEGKLKFTDYDGNLQSELAQACSEISTGTALGSYAVEYMSFDLNRIVTYYEATIYITYRHSKNDVENISYISGKSRLADEIADSLDGFKTQLAVSISSQSISDEMVAKAIEEAYTKNPEKCVVLPKIAVSIHPKQGVYRIIEITFEYSTSIMELKEMREELNDRIDEIYTELDASNAAVFTREASKKIIDSVEYDIGNASRRVNPKLADDLGETAYGALVEAVADSRGRAIAYNALCSKADIECVVVNGLLHNKEHSWNIVTIDDVSYHIDVSSNAEADFISTYFLSDEKMQSLGYWWIIEDYPVCEGMKPFQETIVRF